MRPARAERTPWRPRPASLCEPDAASRPDPCRCTPCRGGSCWSAGNRACAAARPAACSAASDGRPLRAAGPGAAPRVAAAAESPRSAPQPCAASSVCGVGGAPSTASAQDPTAAVRAAGPGRAVPAAATARAAPGRRRRRHLRREGEKPTVRHVTQPTQTRTVT